jgi:hypothetical protein
MIPTTAAELSADGFVLERGEGERIQYWRAQDGTGRDEGRIFDAVSGRAFKVNDDGRERAVIVACATVGLGAVAASTLPQGVKDAQSKIILDALASLV